MQTKTLAVTDLKTAKLAMINAPFLQTGVWQRQKERANRVGAHPDIVEFERRFIAKFAKMNIPMFTVYCQRNAAEQDALYVQGRSKARAGQSPHNYGLAVDIVHSVMAWDMPKLCWQIVEHVGKETAIQAGIDVTWGGDFRSIYDPAHWQLANWRDLAKRANPAA